MREDVFMAVVAIHFAANLLSGLLYEIMHIFAINYCSLYYVLDWGCNNHKLHFIVRLIANLITAFLGKPNGFAQHCLHMVDPKVSCYFFFYEK